jgi:CheY-like chemotaxis protein
VEGDPARLQQVFWNLIKNSVKFTPANGKVVIATSNPSADQIEIRINDTGIGIGPEKICKIFNAFEQGQSSITRRFGGLGLGLAISKAMVDAHGGKIQVDSPGKDQGSTFRVFLRTVATPAPAANGSGDTRPGTVDEKIKVDGRNRHILVVDDHHDTCTGMKMMLERRGYDITVAHTADQAAAKARARNFDLLISDIGLPDRSGYELMRELQEKQNMRGIAISGFGTEHDINKARAAGFSEHLTKPINFERLEEAIQNLLDREPVAKS